VKKATENTEILRFPERKICVICEICGFFSGLKIRLSFPHLHEGRLCEGRYPSTLTKWIPAYARMTAWRFYKTALFHGKTVTHPINRLDIARLARICFNFAAQIFNVNIHRARRPFKRRALQLVQQIKSGISTSRCRH